MNEHVWVSPTDQSELHDVGGVLVDASGGRYPITDGRPDLVLGERRQEVDAWSDRYSAVRAAEGRGAPSADYYRRLPLVGPDDPFAAHWAVRAAGFAAVADELLSNGPSRVLDAGCGNGWAAARLAERGHEVAAIDVVLDDVDGLGAVGFHGGEFPVARAEFGHLPLRADSMDAVICLASLHYAPDQASAVAEFARVVRPGGRLFIVDSPVFAHRASGRAMVVEQEQGLAARLEVEVPPTPGRGYIWRRSPRDEWRGLGFDWEMRHTTSGIGARLRRLVDGVRVRREPASFTMMIGTRT